MTDLRAAVAAAPRQRLSGRFWHQGASTRIFESFADPALSEGRYHRSGGGGVWYASDQEQGAWAELFRHFTHEGVDPFEIRRRVGSADITDLEILDLTLEHVRSLLGVSEEDLVGDDYLLTQEIAEAARAAGFGAVLAPSAALPGRRTLAVFAAGMRCVTPRGSAVRQPPPRMVPMLERIRPHPDVPKAVRRVLAGLRYAGVEALRRARRG